MRVRAILVERNPLGPLGLGELERPSLRANLVEANLVLLFHLVLTHLVGLVELVLEVALGIPKNKITLELP